jgi:hypothetical protein
MVRSVTLSMADIVRKLNRLLQGDHVENLRLGGRALTELINPRVD